MIKALARFLVFSNLYVAILLSSLTWATYLLHGWRPYLAYIAAVFFGSLVLYNFHRIYKSGQTHAHPPSELHLWARDNRQLIIALIAIGALGGLAVLPFLSWRMALLIVPAGCLSLWYTVPFLPWKHQLLRLRDIPFLKPLCIAFVVSYLTLLVPVLGLMPVNALQPETFFLFFERMLFLTVITIPFDVRDAVYDASEGLRTLPVVFGFRKSLAIAFSILGMWAILLSLHAMLYNHVRIVTFNFLLLSATAFSLLLLRPDRGAWFYSIAFEGLIGLYFLLALLTGHFFE